MAPTTAIDVILGTGSWGTGTTAGATTLDDSKIIQTLLEEFKRHGHNRLDSARAYGNGTSEAILAELDYTGQGFFVDTKINSFYPGAHTTANIEKSLKESLTALQQNKVHILYFHAPDRTIPIEEGLAAINEAYKKGHFEQFGLSNFTAAEVEEIVKITKEKGYVQPTVYQGLYNLISRANEKELFPVLRKHGISFYAYSPLGGAFLSDAMNKDYQPGEKTRFDPNTIIGQGYRAHYFKDSMFQAVDRLKEAAKKHNITVQEIALRWIEHHSQLNRKYNDAIVIGGSKLENIRHTLDSLERGPLPADVLQVVEDVWKSVPENEAPSYHM